MHVQYGIDVAWCIVVVVGRSNIVGLSFGIFLLNRNATVTKCNSRTIDAKQEVRQADITVATYGISYFV